LNQSGFHNPAYGSSGIVDSRFERLAVEEKNEMAFLFDLTIEQNGRILSYRYFFVYGSGTGS
jgi:hypothetical protein